MTALLQDLRDAFRHLRSRPGFATVVVLTLSMGIGLNAAVFTAVDAALLRSSPTRSPTAWCTCSRSAKPRPAPLRARLADGEGAAGRPLHLRRRRRLRPRPHGLDQRRRAFPGPRPPGERQLLRRARRPPAARTHLPPRRGRGRRPPRRRPHRRLLALADGRRSLGARPEHRPDDLPFTIVGVLPPTFPFAPGEDARVVLAVQPKDDLLRRNLNWVNTIARLRDGVTLRAAQQGAPPSLPRSASASPRR